MIVDYYCVLADEFEKSSSSAFFVEMRVICLSKKSAIEKIDCIKVLEKIAPM